MVQPILDGRNFQIAGALQPFNDDTTPLLQKADPVLFYALDFWTYIIRTYPGPALVAAASVGAGLKDMAGNPITNAVAQAYPDDPVPYLQSTYLRFPVLGVYRKESEYRKHSAIYYNDYCSFDLIYILPPLDAAQAEGILPILRAVETAVKEKTVQSLDPGYAPPGGTLGQTPWGLNFAALKWIGFQRGERGRLNVGNQEFPFLLMHGYFDERDMYLSAQNLFTGVDLTVDMVNTDGTRVHPFAQFSTQRAPTITTILPNTGSINGGNGITINGTLFLPQATVLIGTQPASNVVVVNSTEITCTTPSVGGSGTVDVTVTNPDGQIAVATQTFTYQ